jgi:hypothetical protein
MIDPYFIDGFLVGVAVGMLLGYWRMNGYWQKKMRDLQETRERRGMGQ